MKSHRSIRKIIILNAHHPVPKYTFITQCDASLHQSMYRRNNTKVGCNAGMQVDMLWTETKKKPAAVLDTWTKGFRKVNDVIQDTSFKLLKTFSLQWHKSVA